jgi:hypothetical protein
MTSWSPHAGPNRSGEDRSQFYKDLAVQFYGANRPGAKVSHVDLVSGTIRWRAQTDKLRRTSVIPASTVWALRR